MRFFQGIWSGRRGSNSQLSAWEAEFSIVYFQHLQNRSENMHVHALHTVHALPDLRVAAGRLRDVLCHALLLATANLTLTYCFEASRFSR
jgi:hypothetical protein